jgi:rare lipoprotein A
MTAGTGQNVCALLSAASGAKLALGAAVAACTLLSGAGPAKAHDSPAATPTLSGIASWYGPGFHGRQTANGERYNMYELTAAHRSLPFGTKVRVTNRANGKSVVVRINDRGPYVGKRVIDLSRGAAQVVNMTEAGIVPVKLDVLPSL